jgi:hypothetical protein
MAVKKGAEMSAELSHPRHRRVSGDTETLFWLTAFSPAWPLSLFLSYHDPREEGVPTWATLSEVRLSAMAVRYETTLFHLCKRLKCHYLNPPPPWRDCVAELALQGRALNTHILRSISYLQWNHTPYKSRLWRTGTFLKARLL